MERQTSMSAWAWLGQCIHVYHVILWFDIVCNGTLYFSISRRFVNKIKADVFYIIALQRSCIYVAAGRCEVTDSNNRSIYGSATINSRIFRQQVERAWQKWKQMSNFSQFCQKLLVNPRKSWFPVCAIASQG